MCWCWLRHCWGQMRTEEGVEVMMLTLWHTQLRVYHNTMSSTTHHSGHLTGLANSANLFNNHNLPSPGAYIWLPQCFKGSWSWSFPPSLIFLLYFAIPYLKWRSGRTETNKPSQTSMIHGTLQCNGNGLYSKHDIILLIPPSWFCWYVIHPLQRDVIGLEVRWYLLLIIYP